MRVYSSQDKLRARSLRQSGLTYQEICQNLKISIPKGTLSRWVSGIIPPTSYETRIKQSYRANIRLAQAKNRQILEQRLSYLHSKNTHTLKSINREVALLILATLYWCEGAKYPASQGIKFGSSDPGMIKLFTSLLRACFKIDESKLRLTVQCRSDQDQSSLSTYWQEVTEIKSAYHYHPRVDQRSIGRPTTKQDYKGVCVVTYLNTNIQCEIQFLGKLLGEDDSINLVKNRII